MALPEPRGSNGFAIGPTRSATGHALLWINPLLSHRGAGRQRPGLNAYGALTWGQFFIQSESA